MSITPAELLTVTGDAILSGMSALIFVCEPETWPVFAAWAEQHVGAEWGEKDRETYRTFARVLAEISREMGTL